MKTKSLRTCRCEFFHYLLFMQFNRLDVSSQAFFWQSHRAHIFLRSFHNILQYFYELRECKIFQATHNYIEVFTIYL